MSIQEIIMSSGGVLLILMTLIQITPLKVNPWSEFGKLVGRVINKEVIAKLNEMEATQNKTQERLDEHIRTDDERNADLHRTYILRFNTELLRKIEHTEEDFNEILYNVDCYERYCKAHPEYQNNRAVHAIKHIKRVYDEHLENGTFLNPEVVQSH